MAHLGWVTAIHPTNPCTRPKVGCLHIVEFVRRVMGSVGAAEERPEALRGSLDEAEILQRLAELTDEVVERAEQEDQPLTMVFSDMGELMAHRQAQREAKGRG